MPQPPKSILFPYTTLFRSVLGQQVSDGVTGLVWQNAGPVRSWSDFGVSQNPQNVTTAAMTVDTNGNLQTVARSEEHTSELQSRQYLVCRLLLEKKKNSYVS